MYVHLIFLYNVGTVEEHKIYIKIANDSVSFLCEDSVVVYSLLLVFSTVSQRLFRLRVSSLCVRRSERVLLKCLVALF